ncbi:MAG TPA: hypothetical protein VLC94_03660 [Candidatus Acidoferrum sp.]|nr:hypothetical protein [Candidatus Acidoferrum sp.]
MKNCANLDNPGAPPPDGLRACSACAGDYEDPDRTAWREDDLGGSAEPTERRNASSEKEEGDQPCE